MLDVYLLNKNKRVERMENTEVIPIEETIIPTPMPIIETPMSEEITQQPSLQLIEEEPIIEKEIVEEPVVTKNEEEKTDSYIGLKILGLVIIFFVNLYAAMLSWSCNRNIHLFARILFALFAFLFGIIYILLHLLFRDTINPCLY